MPDDVTPQDESFENDAAEEQDANTPSVDQADAEEEELEAASEDVAEDAESEEPQDADSEGGSSIDDEVERQMLDELQSSDEVMDSGAEPEEGGEESIDDLVEKQMLAELEKMDSEDGEFDDGSSSSDVFDEPGGMFDSPEVQKAEFQQLSGGGKSEPQNLDLLLDVDLPLSIELGRTKMKVQEILNLGPGSVVELNKLAGEPVDLLVNNKIVAKGEVVVIDENFGLRITSLISPQERLKSLGE